MLKTLPVLSFPITASSVDPLFDSIVKLNTIDAGVPEPVQRALSLYLHCIDLFVKSKGKYDYRGVGGHSRLKQDAFRFCPSSIVTRHGDLSAAHLAIDWSDTAIRCMQSGLPLPSNDVNELLLSSKDLAGMPPEDYKRVGVLLDWLSKKQITS